MSAHLFKHLALSASVAVMIMSAGIAARAAEDDAGMPAMPAPTVQAQSSMSQTSDARQAPLTIDNEHNVPMAKSSMDTGLQANAVAPSAPAITATMAPGRTTAGLPGKVTLADAVSFGVATNPEYLRNADNRRATDEELRQAKGLWMPSLDLNADLGYERSDNITTRNIGSGDPETLFRRQAGLTLTQLLFDGSNASTEKSRQEARVLSAAHRVKEAAELTGVSVVEAYLDVLRQRQLLVIARENVNSHLNIVDQLTDSATAGRSTAADSEQSRARLASARANEASVREALRIAEASFIQQVGDAPQDLVMPLTPVDRLEKNVEEEIKISLHQSPTIDIYEADVAVAHEQFEQSKSTLYPKVNLQLNGRAGRNTSGIRDSDNGSSALVLMNWNLYRGGIDTANIREQISREAQAKEERSKAARQVENDVRTTWARMVSAGERAKEFADQAASNTETVKAYRDQFDLSRRTLLDVLDAQNELFVSKSNAINAEFVEMFAVYRLLGLKGELMPTLGIAFPREGEIAQK